MKFVIAAVVVLAIAMGVQSSIVAGYPGLGLGVSNLELVNGAGLGVNGYGLGVNGYGLGLGGVNGYGLGLGGVNGYGLGLGANGLGLGLSTLGLGVSGYGAGIAGQSLVQGPAYLNSGLIKSVQIPAAVNIVSSPLISSVQIPAAVAVAPQAAVVGSLAGHGATYVAKNRGAIHTAPLAGHIKSTASINVAPAPGTW